MVCLILFFVIIKSCLQTNKPLLMEPHSEENVSFEPIVLPGNPVNSDQAKLEYPVPWMEEKPANFICRLCMKTFYNANALQNHRRTQHDGEMRNPEFDPLSIFIKPTDQNLNGFCGFKFIPLKKDNDESETQDGLVTKIFSEDTTYLIVHIEGDDLINETLKQCPVTNFSKKQAMKPRLSVDLRGPFTCTFPSSMQPGMQCRQIFFNCCDYSLHYREEHTKRRKAALRCQVCEKRLDRDVPTTSTNVIVPRPVTFSCRLCARTFRDSAEYDEHNRTAHAKLKPHQCTICAKRFTQQGGLQQHMRMHTGIRPFVCTFCPKAFTQKAGLDQHLRTHTKVKPFKCIICSKCFSQSVHLRQHMRTHTNIQPFECPVCGRKFKQSSHLNFHMRSHVSDGSLVLQHYAQQGQGDNQSLFLNLSNFQAVQDGEILYYAAELAPENSVPYQPTVTTMPSHGLPI